MAEKKAKVPICPRCGYGMGIWRTQKLCKACLEVEGNSSAEASLAVVKQKLASKPGKEILQAIMRAKSAEKDGLTTIWTQKRHPVQDYEHPTQKPVELVERAILNSSREGEIVLEPFAGSGTTLIAAEKSGRRSLNIELDPKYVEVILRRYRRITGKSISCINRDTLDLSQIF